MNDHPMTARMAGSLAQMALGRNVVLIANQRDIMLRRGWICEIDRVPAKNGGWIRKFVITDTGIAALKSSPHYESAMHQAESLPSRGGALWL